MGKTTIVSILRFKKEKRGNKNTYDINIYNKDERILGYIYWKNAWKCYVFESEPGAIYDQCELQEVLDTIKGLENEEK